VAGAHTRARAFVRQRHGDPVPDSSEGLTGQLIESQPLKTADRERLRMTQSSSQRISSQASLVLYVFESLV
jgi:hypothetical protein